MGGNDRSSEPVELLVTDTEARLRDAVEREAEQSLSLGWRQRHFDALADLIRYVRAEARVETIRVCCADGDDRGWCHINGRPCTNCEALAADEAELDALKEIP